MRIFENDTASSEDRMFRLSCAWVQRGRPGSILFCFVLNSERSEDGSSFEFDLNFSVSQWLRQIECRPYFESIMQ